MKRQNIWALFCVIGFYLFAPQQSYAQAAANKSNQDQIVQEILNEVRQLRVEVQRLKASAYQTQVVIERLRLQQDQVTRLTREIGEVRDKISETQTRQEKLKGTLEETEKQVQAGVISPSAAKKISADIEESKQREQRLNEQEAQLSRDLETERVKLMTLNRRLDELGQEATPPGGEKRTNKDDE